MTSQPDTTWHLAFSPMGSLYLAEGGPGDESLPPRVLRRIERAFARGQGHGLLQLGVAELQTELPPSFAFWRELGRRYLSRVCAIGDLESCREELSVDPDEQELDELSSCAPPMIGGEYLCAASLAERWRELEEALRAELASFSGTVAQYLRKKSPVWSLVGRVCLHLVENKQDSRAPFAFLATYASRVSAQAQVQHKPLSKALQEFAGARNRKALLALLEPVQQAATQSSLVRELVDSRAIFHPLSWSPKEAHRFLRDIPQLEANGVMVRVPDWWQPRHPPRPQVRVTIGGDARARLGLDEMLDFSVELVLDGEPLSREELRRLLAGKEELALVRGRWVEVDHQQLEQVLARWREVERVTAEEGISFAKGMRLICGAGMVDSTEELASEEVARWSEVVAGDWLTGVLGKLRQPQELGRCDPGEELHAVLRPYQQVGVHWLWYLYNLGLGACLADDMGLGKTIQVLALLLLIRRREAGRERKDRRASLLVVPASIIANWRAEIHRFTPSLRPLIAHPSVTPTSELKELSARELAQNDVVITSYGTLLRLPGLASTPWELVVLDEAQAIKNPRTKQSRVAKSLRCRSRVALTGTPVENRLSDLWSLYDFICPGLLGTAAQFSRFARTLERGEGADYSPLRRLVRPYLLRRLKSDRRIIEDLPDKTEVLAYCGLTRVQVALYKRSVDWLADQLEELDGIQRRGVVLAFLMRLKQICNHPSQWLDDGVYAPGDSGKFGRLSELCEQIAARQERALIFTQFRQLTRPLADFLRSVFGRPGLVMHGQTAVKKRQKLVDSFQQPDGPPFFVLSLKVGGTGLNLTAASHVIHFDRWWNPAVETQATDRAYRIGQRRNVLVHKFLCRGTVEERIERIIEEKRGLSTELLQGGGEALLTELPDDELISMVSLDINSAVGDS